MACGAIEKMPSEVKPKEQVSAQNGHSRTASLTVGPGRPVGDARGTRPGAPRRDAPPRQHQQQRNEGRADDREHEIGVPPAVGGDQVLGERQDAPWCRRPRPTRRRPAPRPGGAPGTSGRAARRSARRDSAAPPKPMHDAERDIEMPDLGGERGRRVASAAAAHADHGEHAQAETIDDPARDRRAGCRRPAGRSCRSA